MAVLSKPIGLTKFLILAATLATLATVNGQLIVPDHQPEPLFTASVPAVTAEDYLPTTPWTPTLPTLAQVKASVKPSTTASTKCRGPNCICQYKEALSRYYKNCGDIWWCGFKPSMSEFCDAAWMLDNAAGQSSVAGQCEPRLVPLVIATLFFMVLYVWLWDNFKGSNHA